MPRAYVANFRRPMDRMQERRELAAHHPEGERNLLRPQDPHEGLGACYSHELPPELADRGEAIPMATG